ncbi:immunity 49 family protein [Vibrio mangrovi]|uniref:Immunity 49 family protein n=1 Tax=Vibrio mangrovi TaxID=474394 RepID=A0A1Y6ITG7_9VIBR|nr:immunity 49 family protein [Vibrio mangrovi]MDW6004676.1 immunity 49 family protein [Vibrio mangrovi]SMS00967.1 hypothetical protein VIM7927_02243 [Vibrio mangrovi]
MTKVQLAHHIQYEYDEDERNELLEDISKFHQLSYEYIESKPLSVSIGGYEDAFSFLGKMNYMNWDKQQTIWMLQEAWELLEVHYQIALHPGEQVMCQYAGLLFEAEGKITRASNSLWSWIDAMSIAMILRQSDLLNVLLAFDESFLDIDDGAQCADPTHRFEKALLALYKGLFTPKADIATLLRDVAEKSAPEYIGDKYAQNFVYGFYLPLIPLIEAMYRSDRETAYPKALLRALEAHKNQANFEASEEEYFVSDHKWDSKTWVSLPITGLAALAYQRWKLEPNVETKYLPQWWVTGESIPKKRLFINEVFK